MIDQSIKDKYSELLKAYVHKPDEKHLLEAADVGWELIGAEVPTDDVVEMHEEALKRLTDGHSEAQAPDTIRHAFTPLIEMLMTYSLAFQKQLLEHHQLEQHKNESISNISHELRTPLHSIKGFTKLMLQGKVPDSETQKEFLTIIDKLSEHLSKLIDNLLDMSRLESGQFQIQKRHMSIKNTIHDAVESFSSLDNEKGIVINEDILPTLPEMEVDGERVGQVMANLLSNAIKFSNDGGSVTVKAKVKGDELLVQVTDYGIGIAEEAIPHLFERFQQGEAPGRIGGSGLGLYISKQIIEAHGGRIWAESKEGEGSTFSFTLPLRQGADVSPESLMSRKILVIEDEPYTVRLIKYTLEQEGYQVVSAPNGLEGLRKAQNEEPDLILLDVMLPGMDGFEICERLRAEPETAQLPILMLSAKAREIDKATGHKVGANDYLTKPADPSEITGKVQTLLAQTKHTPAVQEKDDGQT